MLLRRELALRGISAFVDERDIQAGQAAEARMKVACQTAKLVIFVVTREFLGSSYCMDELRWTLEQRQLSQQQGASGELPMILPLMYPSKTVRGYTRAELDAEDFTLEQLKQMLTAGTIDVDDLDPISSNLRELIEQHSLPIQYVSQLPGQQITSSLEQRINDLKELAGICCQRSDARTRCSYQAAPNLSTALIACRHTQMSIALVGDGPFPFI